MVYKIGKSFSHDFSIYLLWVEVRGSKVEAYLFLIFRKFC